MSKNGIRILRVVYDHLDLYYNNSVDINLCAIDRITDPDNINYVADKIYTQRAIAISGVNASGKTSTLKLINFALQIVIQNASLNSIMKNNWIAFHNELSIYVYFVYDGEVYKWQADIDKTNKNGNTLFYFKNESIFSKKIKKFHSKQEVFNFTDSDVYIERTAQSLGDALSYIPNDISILTKINKNTTTTVSSLIQYTNANLFWGETGKSIATEILNAFDSEIESFVCDSSNNSYQYKVKFKGQDKDTILKDPFELMDKISSGTIKGQSVISYAIIALCTGGYLIIDELENHFNKEIVKTVIDLFQSNRTNPYGACLIYSTHYMEILDSLPRKDSIYITRKIDHKIDVSNYSTQYKRSDIKKSEVLLAGIIDGTAPQYKYLQALRDYVYNSLRKEY